MKKSASPLRIALFLAVLSCLMAATAASLVTSQNSTLSVPGNRIAMTAFPWTTNLVGSNFILSSVAPTAQQGGKATLVNSLQWSRRYSGGPGSYNNAAYAAVASGRGVVVCGPSYRIGSDYDFATVSYGPDGTALWTNRYDGPVHGYDLARYIATSSTGDIWVVGESQRGSSFFPQDIVLIKYASNGVPAWTNRLASFQTNSSYPWGLTVDASGNAYVTESATLWTALSGTPVGEAITKFDPLGNVVWTKPYPAMGPDSGEGIHRPGPAALDDAGNLIVAGESGRPYYTTGTSITKFAGDGTAVWTNHRPPAIGFGLRTLNLDRAGNAILTGDGWAGDFAAYEIIKCSAGGDTLWTNQVAGARYLGGYVPQAVPDARGDVFFIGGSPGADLGLYQILKFSSTGLPLWTNQSFHFGSTNGSSISAAVDHAGNLYLVGNAKAPGQTDDDIVFMKYTGDGSPLSTNRFAGAPGAADYPFAFVVDDQGNTLITGSSGNSNFVTLKYAHSLVYTPPADFTGLDTLTCTLTDPLGNHATGTVEVLVLPGAFRFDLSPTATRLTPTGLHLQLSGLPGTNAVVLETSPDLISWQRILTNAPAGNSVEFLDPSALTLPRRFYRASQQP